MHLSNFNSLWFVSCSAFFDLVAQNHLLISVSNNFFSNFESSLRETLAVQSDRNGDNLQSSLTHHPVCPPSIPTSTVSCIFSVLTNLLSRHIMRLRQERLRNYRNLWQKRKDGSNLHWMHIYIYMCVCVWSVA